MTSDPDISTHDDAHAELVPSEPLPSLRRRIITRTLFGVAIAGIVAIWVLTPLRHWLDVTRAVDALHKLGDVAWMPLIVILAFVVGGLLIFPVNVLTAAAIIMFGSVLGVVYALIGATLNAMALYEIGHHGGRHLLRRLPQSRLHRLSVTLSRHGILAVAVLRIVPVAPYSIINLMAGASHIRRRDYILGTVLGMTPGTVLAALVVDRVLAAIRQPQLANFLWLAIAVLVFASASVWLGRRMLRASRKPS
ncbi:MAG: VTT domain-containing protein [Rhodanobacteraceae bacterium]